jgi:hypothetical protein
VSRVECDELLLWLARTAVERLSSRPLRSTTAKQGCVLIAKMDDPLASVLQSLTEEHILGCPVVREDGSYSGHQIDVSLPMYADYSQNVSSHTDRETFNAPPTFTMNPLPTAACVSFHVYLHRIS